RAVVELHGDSPDSGLCLVAVAAILVASIKLHCLQGCLDMKYQGPERINCYAHYRRGDEMGYFQHGSTILLFATAGHSLCEGVASGERISMGQPLLSGPGADPRELISPSSPASGGTP
ncbi:MAG: phosphatidylserine decarboxylase, partial [Halieaceae bacterium]|nr:phosphatidylserine decarboxylase [Halieaceae bacterium]